LSRSFFLTFESSTIRMGLGYWYYKYNIGIGFIGYIDITDIDFIFEILVVLVCKSSDTSCSRMEIKGY
jgi:hypothetical protein